MQLGIQDFLLDLQYRWPFMFRVKGTVILRIWWQVLFVIAYTSAVVVVDKFVPGMAMNFNQYLINVLGVVIGLLLVFRTNTAYDRYWEGRRLWSSMNQNIRTLTRCIWVGVKESSGKDIIEKRSVINLLIAFAYATKNYLREEYSYDGDGIKELIKHIPKFHIPSSNQPPDSQGNQEVVVPTTVPSVSISVPEAQMSGPVILLPNKLEDEIADGKNIRKTLRFRNKASSGEGFSRQGDARRRSSKQQLGFTAHDCVTPTNIPIELSYHIQSYIYSVSIKGRDLTDPSSMLIMNHGGLGWFTLPAVTLASFALLGILGIGWEIENPFGYDDNDLPLDDFCKVIHKEIQTIVGNQVPSLESWINSPNNHPFAPTSMEDAVKLSTRSIEELRTQLSYGAAIKCPHTK